MMLPPGGVDDDEVAPYDDPCRHCPACGGGEVRHLVIGMPIDPEAMTRTPAWVDWVGCGHPGYDRECERCGLTWDSEDPPRLASPR
jgi:hypothetical protein